MKRDITFFHTDAVERQTSQAVATEASRRGYAVRFSDQIGAPAEIGFYCSHRPSPSRSRFSAIMLHDLAQRHDVWPDFWKAEPWDAFDLGFLPGPSWSERWRLARRQPECWPRRGVFDVGWPKADALYSDSASFRREASELRQSLGLRHERSILYAPSWENHGKQDDFVRALSDLPVNLLLKQAPWSQDYPRVLESIREMNALHRNCSPDVHIIAPEVGIIHCLALADLMVSDESSVLVEALLLGVPGIAVEDWVIPDTEPPRPASVPFDFVVRCKRDGLRPAVECALADMPGLRDALATKRDQHFSRLGGSATAIMDIIDACVGNQPIPLAPLAPPRQSLANQALSWLRRFRGAN